MRARVRHVRYRRNGPRRDGAPRLGRDGRERAILLTGDRLDAARAYEIGLVDEVVPAEQLATRVDALVQTLLGNAPRSMAWVKQAVDYAGRHPEQPALPFDVLGTQVFTTEDCAEGVAAFLDRRPPTFQGE